MTVLRYGSPAFAVQNDQAIFRGRYVSRRGAIIRIVNAQGLVRSFHARYVWPDWIP